MCAYSIPATQSYQMQLRDLKASIDQMRTEIDAKNNELKMYCEDSIKQLQISLKDEFERNTQMHRDY